MKGRLVFVPGVLLVFCVVYGGCTSISRSVESALSFPRAIPINKLIVGSFTYNLKNTYLVRPDGSCIPEPASSERSGHEAYYEEPVIGTDENPDPDTSNEPMTRIALKKEYHVASYDEVYLWAVQRAAEKAGITNIIAIKSFITITSKTVFGIVTYRQDMTLTVYGEVP